MDVRYTTIDAVIIKSRTYKEQDKLLTYFSLEQGKGLAIARGACKVSSGLGSIAQSFCRAHLTLTPPRNGVSYISQAMPETSFITLDAGLTAMAYASYIGELTDIAMPPGKPSAGFFALLLTVFSLLKMDDDPERAARYFELHLLDELGLLPALAGCSKCYRGLPGGMFHISAKQGCLLCESCGREDQSPLICAGAVQTIKRLLDTPITRLPSLKISPTLMNEIEAAIAYFMDYHLEYSSRAKKVLKQLLD